MGIEDDFPHGPAEVRDSGLADLPDEVWNEAQRRAAVVRPLAAQNVVTTEQASSAAAQLGLTPRTIYNLVRRLREAEGRTSSLAARPPEGEKGRGRLANSIERIISRVVEEEYLTAQRKRPETVVRAVRAQCRTVDLDPPSATTIRARIRAVDAIASAATREGGTKARASRRLTAAGGRTPEAAKPLEVVQIDHTPVDLILVDETHRKPLGRPYLTVAIDVFSRSVAGFLLSLDPPSATSVALCMTHIATPKMDYLRALGIEDADWPVFGVPERIHVDNGAEFHSEA